jgi:CubicO group peptidase (beta-lactamase class C family)
VTLGRIRPGTWRGTVVPLDERFTIYLSIRRDPDGSLRGSFHNPEARWNGGAAWFRITRDGDQVRFTDSATGRVRFSQPYDSSEQRIMMDFGTPMALTPVDPETAVGFRARPAGLAPYQYRVPVPRPDGWATAAAGHVGLDEASLAGLVRQLAGTVSTTDSAPLVHSVLLARHGKLVLEEYFFGFTPDRPHDLRSAGKTLTAILAGAAIDAGALSGVEAPVYPGPDPGKRRITLGHLLTHSSGLACNDMDDASPGNEERMQLQRAEPDWYRFFLDLPVVAEPGTSYTYCSAGFNLAGGVVRTATRTWLPEYFDRVLARPLGIERFHWNLMESGEAYTAGGASLLPRDLLKFGQLFLNGGRWQGRQVVSRAWVNRSTSHQITTPDGGSDGYGWHRHALRVGDRSYQAYEANGNGGQFLIVVPELELVAVITAGNYNQYRIWRAFREFAVRGVSIRSTRRADRN